jgi:hypothetical protein
MWNRLAVVLAFGFALLIAADRANAQTVAVAPYYATPSWDQKIACDVASNCPRFVVLSNWSSVAVLDRETGLTWLRAPDALKTFQQLQDAICKANAHGGRYGWRLPTWPELMSLGDPNNSSADFHLPPGHPFTVDPNDGTAFWTADRDLQQDRGDALDFRYVDPFNGGYRAGVATLSAPLAEHYRAWCVRGPQ